MDEHTPTDVCCSDVVRSRHSCPATLCLRATLREVLEREGYEVVEAHNGCEGLERYQEAPTEVMITDILMPEQEGLETIMTLR